MYIYICSLIHIHIQIYMIPTMLSKNGPTKLFIVTVENAKLKPFF